MADGMLNGRVAEDFELAAIRHGRECERRRDLELLAGVTAGERAVPLPGRGTATLPLPELS